MGWTTETPVTRFWTLYFFMPFIYLIDKITPHPDALITQHSSPEGLQWLVMVWEDWNPQMNVPDLSGQNMYEIIECS